MESQPTFEMITERAPLRQPVRRVGRATERHKIGLVECAIVALGLALVALFALYTADPQLESELPRPYAPLGAAAR
jgi:hypothetical protein